MRNPAAVTSLSVHAAMAGGADIATAAARTPKTSAIVDRLMARSPFVSMLQLDYAEGRPSGNMVFA